MSMIELNRLFGLAVGLEDEGETNPDPKEDTVTNDTSSNEGDTPSSEEPTDNEEAIAPKNQVEEVKDESVKQTEDAPTNQPDKVEDGKTAVEKEFDYWARVLDFSQFKEAESVEKIKDYVSIQEVDDTHPVKSKTRVRRIESKEGVKYELTIKVGNDVTQRMENTTKITEDTFNIMAQANSQYVTNKHRYHYQNEDGNWVVDLFPNGKGGYYEWAHVEVEVKELPEKAPGLPIKAEEIIYPKGQNTKLTDEEATAKIKEITARIDTLDTPIYETAGSDTEGSNNAPPTKESDNSEGTSTQGTDESTDSTSSDADDKKEEEPLTADDISRNPEQVEENEETLKEQGLSEEGGTGADTDSTEDTSSEDDGTDNDETNDTENEEGNEESEANQDAGEGTSASVTDEDTDEDSDDESKKQSDKVKEGTESLLSGLESLIELRLGVLEDVKNNVPYSRNMRNSIYQAVHAAIPNMLLSKVHYFTGIESFNDENTGGFTEETLDVIENGITTLLNSITQQVVQAVASIDAPMADTVNMKPTLMRLHKRTQSDTGTVDTNVSVLATSTLNSANEFNQGNRVSVYQSLLKGLLLLMNHYDSERGFTDELVKALPQYVRQAKAVLIPKSAIKEDEGNMEYDVYRISVPNHTLTYVVFDTDDELLVKVNNGQVSPNVDMALPATEDIVSHTEGVPDPAVGHTVSIKEMTDAVNQSIDAKLALGQYMTNLGNIIPALALEVKNKINQAGYLNKDTIGAGELHLLTTITSVLNLIREEVQFIVHLSQIDSTLKEQANKLLFEVNGGL